MRFTRTATLLGIAVAANPASAQLTAERPFRLVQEMRIDAVTEDLSNIQAVRVGPRGLIAFTQPQDFAVMLYDPSGKRVYKFGRQGAGPGEFGPLLSLGGFTADSVWAYDYNQRRVTVIAPDGKLGRTVTLPSVRIEATDSSPPIADTPRPYALYSDGMLVAATRERVTREPITGLPGPPSSNLAFAGYDGVVRRVVARQPDAVGQVQILRGGGMFGRPVPFAPDPKEAMSHDGKLAAFLTTTIGNDHRGTYTITVIRTPSGDTALKRTNPFNGVAIPRSRIDSTLEAMGRGNARMGEAMQQISLEIRDAAAKNMPKTYPPVNAIEIGVDGTIWIRPTNAQGRPDSVWVGLDERGTLLGSVRIPARTTFRAMSRTHVWATVIDADGLQSVVRFRLER